MEEYFYKVGWLTALTQIVSWVLIQTEAKITSFSINICWIFLWSWLTHFHKTMYTVLGTVCLNWLKTHNLSHWVKHIFRNIFTLYSRINTHHFVATFLPTFCLIIMAEMTLFIDVSHFEATIMVALTSMLVMYTLYQSIAANLPQTAYLKMIDIWLIGGLMIPFIIFNILIAIDMLILSEKARMLEVSFSSTYLENQSRSNRVAQCLTSCCKNLHKMFHNFNVFQFFIINRKENRVTSTVCFEIRMPRKISVKYYVHHF